MWPGTYLIFMYKWRWTWAVGHPLGQHKVKVKKEKTHVDSVEGGKLGSSVRREKYTHAIMDPETRGRCVRRGRTLMACKNNIQTWCKERGKVTSQKMEGGDLTFPTSIR
jgi:hypothetical protein